MLPRGLGSGGLRWVWVSGPGLVVVVVLVVRGTRGCGEGDPLGAELCNLGGKWTLSAVDK